MGGVMRKGKGASIMDYFETLEDPRIDRCKRRQLLDIIAIAICAVICGADSWVYVELFGKSKLEWFRTFLELPHGVPSHDTFGDVFSRLDPEQFQQRFMAWTQAVLSDAQAVSASRQASASEQGLNWWVRTVAGLGAHHGVRRWAEALGVWFHAGRGVRSADSSGQVQVASHTGPDPAQFLPGGGVAIHV